MTSREQLLAAIAEAEWLRAEATEGPWLGVPFPTTVADVDFLVHARNVDPWSALKVAVETLSHGPCMCPNYNHQTGGHHPMCYHKDVERALAAMAALLWKEGA